MQATRIKAIVIQYGGLLVAIAVLVLFFGAMTKNFFTATTLLTVANTIPDITVVAVGMTLVLIAGGIDLSVGSVMAFSGSLLGVLLLSHKWPLAMAAGGAVLLGAVCGGLNGWISAYFRIPAFIVTLGMLEVARGGASWMTDSTTA